MRYALNKSTIHSIIPTLDYSPVIDDTIGNLIRIYILEQCNNMNIEIYHLEVMPDHIHLIHQLNPRIRLCDIIQNIKGGSSHFVNSSKLSNIRFAWNPGPINFSLGSKKELESVIHSFENHQSYHQNHSIQEEIASWRERYILPLPITKENINLPWRNI